MKTQNTLENKARFFAQYWGVKCLKNELLNELIPAQKVDKSNCNGLPQQFLELMPLSQISDEDVIEITKLTHGSKFLEQVFTALPKDKVTKYIRHITDGLKNYSKFDYLRSKGYALPYMDLSVEDLIEHGWVKLKEN